MPKSAIPPYILERDWKGTDNDSWWQRIKKHWFQYPLSAGPRVPSGFWKWRWPPKTLFAIRGKGAWRYEIINGNFASVYSERLSINDDSEICYLSRIQPWCRWHFAIQWPLSVRFHVIYKQKDVVNYPTYQSNFGIKKMFTFQIGWIEDSSKYYSPTGRMGGNFE